MLNITDCVEIGFVAKCHGIEGELVLRPADGFDADIFDRNFLLLLLNGGLVPFPVENLRPKGAEQTIAKLEFCDSHEKARELCGVKIFAERSHLQTDTTEDDQIEVGLLVGFCAREAQKGKIGEIVAIENLGDVNPLFVLQNANNEEFYIPIADDFIAEIDTENREITFELPEGLLDL